MKLKLIDYGYGKIPNRAHHNDSGADVFSLRKEVIKAHSVLAIGIGLGAEIPDGYDLVIHCKSGLSKKGILAANAPIDAGYTGEIHAILYNSTDEDYVFEAGEKIGQLVLRPVVYCDFVTDLDDDRGANGFGSTGK